MTSTPVSKKATAEASLSRFESIVNTFFIRLKLPLELTTSQRKAIVKSMRFGNKRVPDMAVQLVRVSLLLYRVRKDLAVNETDGAVVDTVQLMAQMFDLFESLVHDDIRIGKRSKAGGALGGSKGAETRRQKSKLLFDEIEQVAFPLLVSGGSVNLAGRVEIKMSGKMAQGAPSRTTIQTCLIERGLVKPRANESRAK